MKYFLDTEFIEDGKTIELISLGVVSEDDRELYLVSSEFDPNRADEWVKTHVLNHISPNQKVHTLREIRDQFFDFVGKNAEFWGYYCDYDWVVICRLWGRMVDLPKHFPKYCNDLKQFAGDIRLPKMAKGTSHVAIDDARWVKQCYEWLTTAEIPASPLPIEECVKLNEAIIKDEFAKVHGKHGFVWDGDRTLSRGNKKIEFYVRHQFVQLGIGTEGKEFVYHLEENGELMFKTFKIELLVNAISTALGRMLYEGQNV